MQEAHMYCDAINQESAHQAQMQHGSKGEASKEGEDDGAMGSFWQAIDR
jgi:hypothetical protein